jgi:hypothetical protein
MRLRRLVAVALVLALPGCTVGVRRARPTAPATSSGPAVTASPPACRTAYAKPDPERPRITLAFAASGDLGTVRGSEHVVFTPDSPVTEVVFRLWPNNPLARGNGARLVVTRASLSMRTEALGGTAEAPTLVALTLPAPSPAGRAVTVDLDFVLTLPKAAVDRWGHAAGLAWWGSAHPLLAWQRGVGWRTEPAIGLLGETATSEAADYDVTVTAPAAFTVLGNGVVASPRSAGTGRRWHFRNPVARDVAVVIGELTTRRSTIAGVPVLVAVSAELAGSAEAVLGPVSTNAVQAVGQFVRRFGAFPYAALTLVAMEHVKSAGVEYPGMIFVGSRRYDDVVPHEVAHQWFYGLVGDDQARDPWLDEAFATYAQSLFNDDAENFLGALDSGGDVGAPMTYWDRHRRDYGRVVYAKGAAALLTARDTVGEATFDALLRCYVAEQAYRIATPTDLLNALAPAPEAVRILRDAGAFPG